MVCQHPFNLFHPFETEKENNMENLIKIQHNKVFSKKPENGYFCRTNTDCIIVEVSFAEQSDRWVVRCLKDNKKKEFFSDKTDIEITVLNHFIKCMNSNSQDFEQGMSTYDPASHLRGGKDTFYFVVYLGTTAVGDDTGWVINLAAVYSEEYNEFVTQRQLINWSRIFSYLVCYTVSISSIDLMFEDDPNLNVTETLLVTFNELVTYSSETMLNCGLAGIVVPSTFV